jgi:hypothetical protein
MTAPAAVRPLKTGGGWRSGRRAMHKHSAMSEPMVPLAYQLRVALRGIGPLIRRRPLVRGDSTVADLHHTLQITMGWSDTQLHRFLIHGRACGIARLGGRPSRMTRRGSAWTPSSSAPASASPIRTTSATTGSITCASSRSAFPTRGAPIRSAPMGRGRHRRKAAAGRGPSSTCGNATRCSLLPSGRRSSLTPARSATIRRRSRSCRAG